MIIFPLAKKYFAKEYTRSQYLLTRYFFLEPLPGPSLPTSKEELGSGTEVAEELEIWVLCNIKFTCKGKI